jgi:hypothetical protein
MQMCQMEDIYIQTADGNKSCGWLHHRTSRFLLVAWKEVNIYRKINLYKLAGSLYGPFCYTAVRGSSLGYFFTQSGFHAAFAAWLAFLRMIGVIWFWKDRFRFQQQTPYVNATHWKWLRCLSDSVPTMGNGHSSYTHDSEQFRKRKRNLAKTIGDFFTIYQRLYWNQKIYWQTLM